MRVVAVARKPEQTGAASVPDTAAVMESLPIPVLMLDEANGICFVNGAAEPFFGMSKGQLRQLELRDLVPLDHPLFLLIEQVRLNGSTIVEHELVLEGPRLHRQGITVQGAPVIEAAGFVLLTLHDASAARALDRQLLFRNAARSVSGMAAILAHEVKNPLSGIRGAAQLLEGTVGDSDRELAVLIRDEADRIRALVERMEMFNEKPIERRPVNIHRVLEHVRMLAQRGFAAHLRFVEHYDPSLPPVWGNRDQLVQVLLNLVKNAAEAIGADTGSGEITLSTAYRSSQAGGSRFRPAHAPAADGDGARQRARHSGVDPAASVRAVPDHEGHRHRPGASAGGEDRRRPWRADRDRQPSGPHRGAAPPAGSRRGLGRAVAGGRLPCVAAPMTRRPGFHDPAHRAGRR